MMSVMTFPETVEEFMEQYKVVDTEKVYTNGIELVPIFRMKQWFEHLPTAPHEMSARELLFTRRLNDIIDKLQEQADIHNERAKELLKQEAGQVSQYTWAVSLRETYRRTIRTLEDLLCEAEKL